MDEKLSVRKIIGEGFNIYVSNIIKIILPMAAFAVPYYLIIAKLDVITKTYGPDFIAAYLSLGSLIVPLATAYLNCVVIRIVSNHFLKKDRTYLSYFKISPIMVIGVFIQSIIIGVVTALGFVILVFPGVLVSLGWYIASAVYVNEDDENIFSSISRSWDLTSKNKGQVFLSTLIIGLLTIVLVFVGYLITNQGVIGFSFFTDGSYTNLVTTPVYNIITTVLITPISSVLVVVIYFNLKKLKEGFTVEQLSNNFMENENESEDNIW